MKKIANSGVSTVTIQAALQSAIQRLEKVSDSPALDAELLLSHCLNKERSYLFTWPKNCLQKTQLACFETVIKKRSTDYPVAYLLGSKPFWTLDLIVTPDVLIPRPETELLVETALEKISTIKQPNILDLGTGSGAIALSLASERPDANIIATDNSEAALKIAKKNAKKHHLSSIVDFIQSDWFSNIQKNSFDLIVSNPPYIAEDDPHLLQTIRYEPQQALTAKKSGMSDIETIIKNSPAFLKHKGWLILEHGYNQSEDTLKLLKKSNFSSSKTLNDYSEKPRVSIAKKP